MRFDLNRVVAINYRSFKKESVALLSLITDQRASECKQKRVAILEQRKLSLEESANHSLEWKKRVVLFNARNSYLGVISSRFLTREQLSCTGRRCFTPSK